MAEGVQSQHVSDVTATGARASCQWCKGVGARVGTQVGIQVGLDSGWVLTLVGLLTLAGTDSGRVLIQAGYRPKPVLIQTGY